jgi:hypothetical protein
VMSRPVSFERELWPVRDVGVSLARATYVESMAEITPFQREPLELSRVLLTTRPSRRLQIFIIRGGILWTEQTTPNSQSRRWDRCAFESWFRKWPDGIQFAIRDRYRAESGFR